MLQHLRSRTADKNLLEKGFTLVELLVVIVILGILAAVVVFAVGGTTKDASVSACLSERATLETAIEAYKAQAADANLAEVNPSLGDLKTGVPGGGPLIKHNPTFWTVGGGNLGRVTAHGLDAGDSKCQP